MGTTSLRAHEALAGVERLAVDTAPIIYLIEAHPRYEALVLEVFERIARGSLTGYTSVITLTEVLVHPLKQGRQELVDTYSQLLLTSNSFVAVPIDAAMASQAALLRSRYKIRTPDALQLACAIASGCQGFLTNDLRLRPVKEIPVLALDDWISEDNG